MEVITEENTEMERNVGKEHTTGQMAHIIKVSGNLTKCMAGESLVGQMAGDSKEYF